jgi:hypothetical protein
MKPQSKPVIVQVGQMYYDESKNDYLIVTKHRGDLTSYAGHGFCGQAETESFLDRFQPVDPDDVETDELAAYLNFCPPGTEAKVGYIKD